MKSVKRPLAVIGFTFFITGSMVLSLPKEWGAVLLAVFAMFVFIHYKTKKVFTKLLLLMLTSAVAAVVYVNTFVYFYQNNVDGINTEMQTYTGYVSEINNISENSYIVTLLDEKYREIHNVSIYYTNVLDLADVVEIRGKFKPAKNNKYIYSSYTDNIKGSVSVDELKLLSVKPASVKYKALTFKTKFIKSAEELYDNEFLAVVSAIGYNDKHLLSDKLKSSFKSAGMSHALVVSGLHIGIIAMAVQLLLGCIPINKKVKNIITSVIILAFMVIVGVSPSIIRAGFLGIVALICRNFNKDQDYLTTLALIGLICTIANPFISRDIGAMLSYSATVGIVLANSWCGKRGISSTKNNLICAAAAVVFTLPVTALAGMKITLLSPFINVMLAVFVFAICVLSFITPLLNLIPIISTVNGVLVIANKWLIEAFLNWLALIDKYFGFALVNLSHELFVLVIMGILIALFVSHFQIEDKRLKKIFVISVSIFVFVCYNLLNYNTATVTAFDSGREASFHISAKGREYLVLSEDITVKEAEDMKVSLNGRKYKTVYYCPKEFKTDIDMSSIAEKSIEVNASHLYDENTFTLKSTIDNNKKLFVVSVADCRIAFGHGKVLVDESEYYFLGNDKPKNISAEEIYIFGSTPSWMMVDDIINIDSDVKIKINLKSGKYRTVKDVFNFGYRL